MAMRYRVVDYVIDYLANAGVGHLLGVDGANIEDLYDAAHFNSAISAVPAWCFKCCIP